MKNIVREIYYAFGGKLIGTSFMKQQVCETLSTMPEEVISYITSTCWFTSSMDDAWAFAFTGDDLKGKSLIFFDDLLRRRF